MTSYTAYYYPMIRNDQDFRFGHCTSTWLTAVATAPVWCDERKLVEVSGFMHQKPSWKHQLHGSNGHQRWFALAHKFNSHLCPVVTVCSCWRSQVSVFSTATFVDISDPLRFISCAKSMIWISNKYILICFNMLLSDYHLFYYLEIGEQKSSNTYIRQKSPVISWSFIIKRGGRPSTNVREAMTFWCHGTSPYRFMVLTRSQRHLGVLKGDGFGGVGGLGAARLSLLGWGGFIFLGKSPKYHMEQ